LVNNWSVVPYEIGILGWAERYGYEVPHPLLAARLLGTTNQYLTNIEHSPPYATRIILPLTDTAPYPGPALLVKIDPTANFPYGWEVEGL